jgi:hypothetical protein
MINLTEPRGVLGTLLTAIFGGCALVIVVCTTVLMIDIVRGRPVYVEEPISKETARCSHFQIGGYGYRGEQRFVCACVSKDVCYWVGGNLEAMKGDAP